jgi:ribosomal protein S27AE
MSSDPVAAAPVEASSWIPLDTNAKCPRCGTRLWIRQVRAAGQLNLVDGEWAWEHMCPRCRLQGPGKSAAKEEDRAA